MESDVDDVALAVLVAAGEGAAIALEAAIRMAAETAATTASAARARIRGMRIWVGAAPTGPPSLGSEPFD
jgi:hypothetical protein